MRFVLLMAPLVTPIAQASWLKLPRARTLESLLAKPPPWDKDSIVKTLSRQIRKRRGAVENPLVRATRLVDQLVFNNKEVEDLILWRMKDPWGREHSLFGTIHWLTIDNFSTDAQANLQKELQLATLFLSELGISHPASLDGRLAGAALDGGKRVVGLDSPDEVWQLQLMAYQDQQERMITPDMSREKIDRQLLTFVNDLEEHFHLSASYLSADRQSLRTYLNHSMSSQPLPDFFKASLVERNIKWAERIFNHCQGGDNCLIVAGVSHFLVDTEQITSVNRLLEERGFVYLDNMSAGSKR